MKRNKRAWAFCTRLIGAIVALVCAFSFVPVAHAEEARILITANPTELTDAGVVTFTFEINNYNADYPMTDILINYNGTDYHALDGVVIAPSSQINNIALDLPVAQSQLGKPITFTVKWTRNGEPMSQTAQYTVALADDPTITVTRTADKTNAKPGDKIIVTYTIKNTTKFDMTNVMLIDENISDLPIFQNETLRASRTLSYDYPYIMGEESVTSTPLVTYTVNGKTKTFSSLEPLELTMVRIQLDMRVTAGTPTSTGVTFTLDVTNSGTQAISNILITDERANAVNDTAFNLAPGESRSLSYVVVPLMTEPLRNVQFKLTGTDPFSQPYELTPADIFEVYPFVDASQINVTVRAETIDPWTQDGKKVNIRVTIVNHSSVELTGVEVTEDIIGVIYDYEILPVGESTFDREITLNSPRNLNITVKGYDPTGTKRELAQYPLPVAYGTESAAPTSPTSIPAQAGGVSILGGIGSGIATILIILGILMVFSVVVLVALTAMERSRVPNRFDDEDDDFEDDLFQDQSYHARSSTYHDKPDPEEIRYTQRMFSVKETQTPMPVQEPIRLPAPPVRLSEQPTVIFAPAPPPVEPAQPQADELAQRFVETARTRYTEAQSAAAYRPVFEEAPSPATQQTHHTATPRVFDYKKQAKTQPVSKPTVTRIRKNGYMQDDEEE